MLFSLKSVRHLEKELLKLSIYINIIFKTPQISAGYSAKLAGITGNYKRKKEHKIMCFHSKLFQRYYALSPLPRTKKQSNYTYLAVR